jgi:tungstate transport system permease protein
MFVTVFSDPTLGRIVALSLSVSLSATVVASLLGLPLGGVLAIYRFRGRTAIVLALNALLGLPPVLVGLVLYLLLSRSGPLGALGLLLTPGAMVLAQAILALPIVAALAHRALEQAWTDYGDAFLADGAGRLRALPHLLTIARPGVLTAVLAGFGRTVSEVGAILVVGGNIAGYTRTMTTAIALETSKGDLPLAVGLGLVLIGVSTSVSAAAFLLGGGSLMPRAITRKGLSR